MDTALHGVHPDYLLGAQVPQRNVPRDDEIVTKEAAELRPREDGDGKIDL